MTVTLNLSLILGVAWGMVTMLCVGGVFAALHERDGNMFAVAAALSVLTGLTTFVLILSAP